MIHNITKYFAPANFINSKGPLSKISNVKLQYQQIASINKILTTFFKKFFILISKPVYTITPNGIKISILYFLPRLNNNKKSLIKRNFTAKRKGKEPKSLKLIKMQKAYWNKFVQNLNPLNTNSVTRRSFSRSRLTFLVLLLSKLLRTNVQLELVRIKYVYHDSNILAQFLGINSHRNTFGKFKNLLWRKVSIQTKASQAKNINNVLEDNNTNPVIAPITELTGFKIKISGRLARQRVVPKKTVKTTYKGAISPSKHNLVEQATFTGKNKKGAYSIRVWTSHGTTSNTL
jgi:SepF-like predicted cell division protein (DUF552 family)